MTVGPAILRVRGVRPCPPASHNSRHSFPADTVFQPPPSLRSAWLRFPAVPDTPGLGWLQGSERAVAWAKSVTTFENIAAGEKQMKPLIHD